MGKKATDHIDGPLSLPPQKDGWGRSEIIENRGNPTDLKK
jgi:hypothetical protein